MWRPTKWWAIVSSVADWRPPAMTNKVAVMEQILLLTHPSLFNKKKKMNLMDACTEVWITKQTFYNRLKADPKLRDRWNEALDIRKETVKLVARENIFEWIDWDSKLKPREKIELSKWVLEKTDSDFNPRQVIESKNMNLNFDVSVTDIESQLRDLFTK